MSERESPAGPDEALRGPAHVPPAEFASALAEFGDALGSDGLLADPADVVEFRDPFAFPGWHDFDPSAVLMPASVEEVQAILRIANARRVPLWTSSQGRNNGYGGAGARGARAVGLSRRRL
jgi:4-cresol dehydrogenase (hydroxylating)